jgi:FkbM family methyltransferase
MPYLTRLNPPGSRRDEGLDRFTLMNELNQLVRRFFRAYRNGPIRIGHSFIRRLWDPLMAREQEIQLRSGLKLRLDMSKGNQNAIFWHDGDVDIRQYWAIRELVPLGGLFVDGGANCGLMGLLARQYCSAKVIFIEPHPRLARSIAANIRLNGWSSSCELIEAAISNTSGQITFYEDLQRDGSHAIQPDPGREKDFSSLGQVRCLTLQEIIETRRLDEVHFLKIDTEGNDYPVLQGLGKHLQPSIVEIVYVEMAADRPMICRLMRSKGYTAFASKSLKRRRIVQLQRLYERGGRVAYFEPLNEALPYSGDVLWCGEDSPVAGCLSELHRAAAAAQ